MEEKVTPDIIDIQEDIIEEDILEGESDRTEAFQAVYGTFTNPNIHF